MYFRSILSGTLAVLLLSGAAFARDAGPGHGPGRSDGASISTPSPAAGLPGVFGNRSSSGTYQVAQAGDPRVSGLEEQIRSLNGKVEELNFQILQMQEQLRKMQEDNEFRFQELEGKKKSDAGSGKTNRSVAENSATSSDKQTTAATGGSSSESVEQVIGENGGGTTPPGNGTGKAPTTFGTITFDADGNVTSGSVGDQASVGGSDLDAPANNDAAPSNGAVVAALPATDDPDEVYRNSYQFILSGDYSTAESGFRDHIARFPADPKTADSRYWLGEALLGQQKYRDAAEIFLAANKEFPKAKKAPDMLFKLGVSLVGLHQRDVACATFGEIGKRYPEVSGALKERIKQEQALAAC
ncbi:tol-pal system protein YbgF [Mesorhizobium sp. CGMCC 1.15528]|uniref:Cell division coordinator CpoB n=1 Tax=Mesorhizobium zhangyense TaxID=1776730 RepID=A0A7C9R7W2_9HYPH|nr:tol-pal system protein YbgF [Mesorhizobium zhangyense]NGN42215.1 tol-pal system protein YbgF [Mesorhizobium zhangyense]